MRVKIIFVSKVRNISITKNSANKTQEVDKDTKIL